MRRLLFLLAAVAALAFASTAGAATAFLIRGGGWGHGVGMSQWGAYGYALQGGTYRQILDFYYRGTSPGQIPNVRIGVLVASGRTTLTVGSNAAFTVTGADGRTWNLTAGDHTLGSGLKVTTAAGRHVSLGSPARFHPGTKLLRLNGAYYRGDLELRSSGGQLAAIDRVRMESYLRGVVPRESIASWPAEALKAQAVAARSYAYVTSRNRDFLYPDTRDQVYGGVAAEMPSTDAAVAATQFEVVTYGSAVAQAFFFSSSGGRTANASDVWGSSVPYLVSVNDSAYDKYSPYYRWGSFRYTAAGIGRRLTVPARFYDMKVTRNASGRAASVALIGSTTQTVSGASFQSALGLRSTKFGIGVLRLRGPGSVAANTLITLRGFERFEKRGLGIQQRLAGGAWSATTQLAPNADGTFTVKTRPAQTTYYRPVSAHGYGPVIKVTVG